MNPRPDMVVFEAFQRRVLAWSAWTALVAVAAAFVALGGYHPVGGGLVIGFGASLAAHAVKVRGLRRLGEEAAGGRVRRGGAGLLMRLGIFAAALGAGALADPVEFWAVVGGLLLVNVMTVAVAVAESRRPAAET